MIVSIPLVILMCILNLVQDYFFELSLISYEYSQMHAILTQRNKK